MIRDIHQLKQQQLAAKQDIVDEYTATIVEYNGSIWNDQTKRLNWVQRTDGTGLLTAAYNRSVQAKANMVVNVQVLAGSQYPVIVDIPSELYATLQSALLPDHHTDHEPGGDDMLWLYSEAFLPLCVYPSSSGGLNVSVVRGDYRYNGARKTYGGALAQDLTGNQPSSGQHRLVGLYLDSADTLQTVNGTPVATGSTASDPTWPTGAMPLAVVDLDGDATSISFTDIANKREFNTYGALHNFAATANPTTGDDTDDGYEVGSIWINVTANTAYICVDASSGAADWNQIDGAGGSGGWPWDASVHPTDADADYTTISSAISGTSSGDVIAVGSAGAYAETVSLTALRHIFGYPGVPSVQPSSGAIAAISLSSGANGAILRDMEGSNSQTLLNVSHGINTSATGTIERCTGKGLGSSTTSNGGIVLGATSGTTYVKHCTGEASGSSGSNWGCYVNGSGGTFVIEGGYYSGATADIFVNAGTVELRGPTLANGTVSGTWTGWYYDTNGDAYTNGDEIGLNRRIVNWGITAPDERWRNGTDDLAWTGWASYTGFATPAIITTSANLYKVAHNAAAKAFRYRSAPTGNYIFFAGQGIDNVCSERRADD